MDEKSNGPNQAQKSTKGHTLRRSMAVVGDDDGVPSSREESESADQNELLAFIKETMNKNTKDRNLILRTEAELLQFINSQSQSLPLPGPYSSYQRLLIHRVAAYFHLEHNIDNSGSGLVISRGEKELLSESQRVKFRDLITTNLSQETDGQRKQQRKHTRSQGTLPNHQWTLAPQQRILKVASFDEGRTHAPPHVAKAFSFGGYPRHHNSLNPSQKTPNTLSAEASLSPASSGYKSTSFPSMELRTPSPAGAGPYFLSDEGTNASVPPPPHPNLPPPTLQSPHPNSSQQELVLWAVSDIKSVPPGALLIDPATLTPLRYAGRPEEGQSFYQHQPPPSSHVLPSYFHQLGPPAHPPNFPNYYEEQVGEISQWLGGLSLNHHHQQQYYNYNQHSHHPYAQHHPGMLFPQPLTYFPPPPRPEVGGGMAGTPLRFYFPQSPQFYMTGTPGHFLPKTELANYSLPSPQQCLPGGAGDWASHHQQWTPSPSSTRPRGKRDN